MGLVGSGKSTLAHSLKKCGYQYTGTDLFYDKIKRCNTKVAWNKDKKYIKTVYEALLWEIKRLLKKGNVVVETTGAAKSWKNVNAALNKLPNTKVIKIYIKLPIHLARGRVKTRNQTTIKKHKLSLVNFISNRHHINKPLIDHFVDGRQSQKELLKQVLAILKRYD